MTEQRGGCCGLILTGIWLYLFVASLLEGRWAWTLGLAALMAFLVILAALRTQAGKGN